MIIERGGIKLITLTEENIELVRQKRNLPEVQERMEYREYITPEMQKRWFDSLVSSDDYHFLIEVNKSFIGLISATGIDAINRIVNNGGIFIWDDKYLLSPEIFQASVLLTDFGYYVGVKENYIRVLKDNERAILFNRSLGYELLPDQIDVYNQRYRLTAQAYFKAIEKIRHFGLQGMINVTLSASEFAFYTRILADTDAELTEYMNKLNIVVTD